MNCFVKATYIVGSIIRRQPLQLNAIVPLLNRIRRLHIHHGGISTTPSIPDPYKMRIHARILQVMATKSASTSASLLHIVLEPPAEAGRRAIQGRAEEGVGTVEQDDGVVGGYVEGWSLIKPQAFEREVRRVTCTAGLHYGRRVYYELVCGRVYAEDFVEKSFSWRELKDTIVVAIDLVPCVPTVFISA